MTTTSLKIILRGLWQHRRNTAIHLLGLSLGLATCLLIGLFVWHEYSYDTYHPAAARTYRFVQVSSRDNATEHSGSTVYPLAPALRQDFPDFQAVARVHTEEEELVSLGPTRKFEEKNIVFAEPELLDILAFDIEEGDARATLAQPNQVVISRSLADKYFGHLPAIGQTIKLANELELQVGAVMADPPSQTHLPVQMLVSYASFTEEYLGLPTEDWGFNASGMTYVVLPPGMQPAQLTEPLRAFADKYFDQQDGDKDYLELQPIRDIHLNPGISGAELLPAVNPTYLWILSLVGLFVLIIACINFVNLSTANATRRAREVGVRKVVGAQPGQLRRQFLLESLVLTVLAGVLALLLAQAALPGLNRLVDRELSFAVLGGPLLAGAFTAIVLITTLLAGVYPAFVLSAFRPGQVLKSMRIGREDHTGLLRRALVVVQFTVSLMLIIGTLIVLRQLHYIRHKDLGFRTESVLEIDLPNQEHRDRLLQSWTQHPDVMAVSFGLGAPTSDNNLGVSAYPASAGQDQSFGVHVKPVDWQYREVYDLQLVAGRWLTAEDTLRIREETPSEERQYVLVINEALAERLGAANPADVLGTKLTIGINNITAEVVGVVRNFHVTSLRSSIEPTVLLNFPYFYASAGVRLRAGASASTLDHLRQSWEAVFPDDLYDGEFVDQRLQAAYDDERRLFTLFGIFTGLAVLIGCFGLWGLVTFMIERRTKEIGVRKVLGASAAGIVGLLSADFVRLIALAFVLAAPLAWYGMSRWLENFAYRTDIAWWIFPLAGISATVVALLTVGGQALRAALDKPVKALRSE